MTVAEFINQVGFKVKDSDVSKVNNTISKIKSTATKALGALGIGFSLSKLNALAEEFNGINDQLNYAAGYSEDIKEIQEEILTAANNCRTSYGNMVSTVVNLKQANSELFPLDEAATFTEYLTKLGKAAGYDDSMISSMQGSIQRVVAAGTMGAADITRMARQTPALIEAICEGLGVSREKLEEMAAAGQVTGETLKTAILDAKDSIDNSFNMLDYSISDALLHIRNRFGFFVDDLNSSIGLTDFIGKSMVAAFNKVMGVLNVVRNGIVAFVEKVGGIGNALKLVAIIAGAVMVALNFSKILGGIQKAVTWIKNLGNAFSLARLKVLAIIAVIIIIALLIDDFVNFMKGNNSVIGEMFDRAGIGADNARQAIINAWGQVKAFLGEVWAWIQSLAQQIFGALQAWWAENGEQVKSDFMTIWSAIVEFFSSVWNGLVAIATAIFAGLQAWWEQWGGTVTSIFSTLWNTLVALISPFLDALSGIIDFLANVFTGNWEGAWQSILDIGSAVWDAICIALQGAWDIISALWTGAVDFFSGIFSSIWTAASEAFTNIWTAITEAVTGAYNDVVTWFNSILTEASTIVSTLWSTVSQFFNDIWTAVTDAVTGAYNSATEAFTNMWTGISETVTGIYDTIVAGFNSAIEWITALPSQAIAWGQDIIQGIVDGITGAISWVGDAVGSIADTIASWLHFSVPDQGPLTSFHDWMPDMVSGLSTDLSGSAGSMEAGLNAVANAIKQAFDDAFNDVKSKVSSALSEIESKTSSGMNNMKSTMQSSMSAINSLFNSTFNSIKSAASSTWSAIGSSISSAMNSAKNAVSSAVSSMKSAMNFSWSLPYLRMPHISISGKFSVDPPSAPRFSVSWYKSGGILDGAQIFGMAGGKLLGGGEAGKEAVLPLSELWKNMRTVMEAILESGLPKLATAAIAASGTAAGTVNNRSSSISQNVNINNTFNGDRAIQQNAAKSMDRAGRDITSELARALAYAK